VLLDIEHQARIEQLAVLNDGQQGVAQGGLVGDQEAHRAEVRELARLGHAQAEGRAVGGLRGELEQLHHAVGGEAQVRVAERAAIDPDPAQHGRGVEADLGGDRGVVREGGAADVGRRSHVAVVK
jgi:hypothetical protein